MPTLKKSNKPRAITINTKDRQKVYSSSRWKKLRLAKLMQQPLCEMCLLRKKIVPAVDVHHIDSFLNYNGYRRISLAYDINNLLSLCKECHSWLHRNGTTHSIDIKKEVQLLEDYERKNK